MCCRYWFDELEFRGVVAELMGSPLTKRWQPSAKIVAAGEVRPTDVAPVIAPDKNGNRAVFPMKWGFGGKSLQINARSETAAVKPMFRDAWARNRCIIPASWYFEWEHRTGNDGKKLTGDKYRIRPEGSGKTWLCGLYRIEAGFPVFVVLTREPGESIRFIHNRMPLILPEDRIDEWIRPDADPEALAKEALTGMEFEKAAG